MGSRVIALIDMDCFYAQVEQKLNPEIQGKPCAVVQYKKWKGGSIIAVNYEARDFGVNRSMYGDDAKHLCPDIYLARVPETRGKADLTRYRDASKDVFDVLSQFSDLVERASIDEAYIDLTSEIQNRFKTNDSISISAENLPTTHIIGSEKENVNDSQSCRFDGVKQWLEEIYDESLPNLMDQHLAVAAQIVEKIRAAVLKETGFHCSAGIAHNKMLAKLACGINKPKKQTVVPQSSVPGLFANLSLKKVRNLGGKLGDSLVEKLNCQTMGDLSKISHKELQKKFGDKLGNWLFDLAQGIENEPVIPRQLAKSIGCSKNFFGASSLKTKDQVKFWIEQLSAEVVQRVTRDLHANKRMAKLLNISVRFGGNQEQSNVSRSCPITVYDEQRIAADAMSILSKLNKGSKNDWSPPIHCLALSAGKFQDQIDSSMANIRSFFSKEIPERNETASTNKKIDSESNTKSICDENLIVDESIDQSKSICDEKPISFNEIDKSKSNFVVTDEESNISVTSSVSNISNDTPRKKGFFATKLEEMKRKKALEKSEKISKEENKFDNYATLEVQEMGKKMSEFADKKTAIPKFFTGEEAGCSYVNIDSPLENEDKFKCEDCGKIISVWDSVEHADFHVAIKLQEELRKEPMNVVRTSVNNTHSVSKKGKRKSDKVKNPKSQPDVKMRKLDTFFSRQ